LIKGNIMAKKETEKKKAYCDMTREERYKEAQKGKK